MEPGELVHSVGVGRGYPLSLGPTALGRLGLNARSACVRLAGVGVEPQAADRDQGCAREEQGAVGPRPGHRRGERDHGAAPAAIIRRRCCSISRI